MRTRVKGMVNDTSLMVCRHCMALQCILLGMFDCVNMALHVHLGGE